MMLRSHGSSSSAELLPDDLVEIILEHLPVKPLLRFRSVSKKWKLTIDSRRFEERHLIRRKQSRGPDVLILSLSSEEKPVDDRIFGLGSSIAWTVRLPITCHMYCHGSCDGLFCTFSIDTPSVVANPATGWCRILPLSNYQHLLSQTNMREVCAHFPGLGFGRDKLEGTFKAVWLYNASWFVPKQVKVVTYCEVFDFTTNAWRYVVPSSPYPISDYHKPVHLDGSLYWFTECDEVLSFDLHTETFQVICKSPFSHPCNPHMVTLCILENRLCVSERNEFTQVIWSFDSSGKTWKTVCSLDLTFAWSRSIFALSPIAILDKGRLLLEGHTSMEPLMIYDFRTKSYYLVFEPYIGPVGPVYYFKSLLSAFSN